MADIVREIISNWRNPQYLKLHAGEMTAQEVRTVRAVLEAVGIQITESLMPAAAEIERLREKCGEPKERDPSWQDEEDEQIDADINEIVSR